MELLTIIALVVLLAMIIVMFLLLWTKIVQGRWFTSDGGVIRPRAINQEIIVKYNSDGEPKEIKPKTAFTYVLIGNTIPTNSGDLDIPIDDKFLTRGMIITFSNESDEDFTFSLNNVSGDILARESSTYIVEGDGVLRPINLFGSN